jgi:hypothetical protein
MNTFEALRFEAHRLGVEFHIRKLHCARLFKNVYPCPFNHMIEIEVIEGVARLKLPPIDMLDEEDLCAAIHELGHICVNGDTTSDEFSFLGWEFTLATLVGFSDQWLSSLSDYGVTAEIDFGDLSLDERSDLLEERVSYAVGQGFILGDIPQRVSGAFSTSGLVPAGVFPL